MKKRKSNTNGEKKSKEQKLLKEEVGGRSHRVRV
jgi:hypothetical protein